MSFIPAMGAEPRAVRASHSSMSLAGRSGLRARLVDAFQSCRTRVAAAWDALVHRGRRDFDGSRGADKDYSSCDPRLSLGSLDLAPPDPPALAVSSVWPTGEPATRDEIKKGLRAKLGTSESHCGLFQFLVAQEGPQAASPKFINNLQASRFSNISTAAATALKAPDGSMVLSANRIALDARELAIASQYPREQHMQAYLNTLAHERPSALVVLASEADIARNGLPRYFSESGVYGDVSVAVRELDSKTEEGVTVLRYEMTLSRPGHDDVVVPVLHASEWADCASLPKEQLQALARMTREQAVQAGDAATARDAGGVPFIHCRAGVGRSGQLIATLALEHAPGISLETVIAKMREQRNAYMVQTDDQLDTLVDLWLDNGRAVFAVDEDSTLPFPGRTASPMPAARDAGSQAVAASLPLVPEQPAVAAVRSKAAPDITAAEGLLRISPYATIPNMKVLAGEDPRARRAQRAVNAANQARPVSAPPDVSTTT